MGFLFKTQFGQSSPNSDPQFLLLKSSSVGGGRCKSTVEVSLSKELNLQLLTYTKLATHLVHSLFAHAKKGCMGQEKRKKECDEKLSGFMGNISEDSSFCLPS